MVAPTGALCRMVVPKGLHPTVFQTVSTGGGCAEWIAPKGRSRKGSRRTAFPDGLRPQCIYRYMYIYRLCRSFFFK